MAAAQLAGEVRQPPLIYSSRTHSQLTQVIRELRRTSYKCGCSVGLASLSSPVCLVEPRMSPRAHGEQCRGLESSFNDADTVRDAHDTSSEVPINACSRLVNLLAHHVGAAGHACASWAPGSRCACIRPCPA